MKKLSKIKLLILTVLIVVSSLTLTACGKLNAKNYTDDSRKVTYQSYNDVTVDGDVTDTAWANQNKLVLSSSIGGVTHEIESTSIFTDEGVLMSWSVKGAPAYYNSGRALYDNSGIEIYIATGDKTTINGNAWEIDFLASGVSASRKRIGYHTLSNNAYKITYAYREVAASIDFKAKVDGTMNDYTNNGYTLEFMIPWYILDVTETPEYVCVDAAVIYSTSEVGTRSAWYSLSENNRANYSWTNPQGWYKFDKDGYHDDTTFDYWQVSDLDKNITVSEDNKDVTVRNIGWNGGNNFIPVDTVITGDSYQEVTIFKTSSVLEEFADEEEYNKNMWETEEEQTANKTLWDNGLGGLYIKSLNTGGKYMCFVSHFNSGVWGVRYQGDWYKEQNLSEALMEKYSDPEVGLRIGLLNIGTMMYGYYENENGQMTQFLSYDLTKRGFTEGCQKIVGLQTNTDAVFKDYKLYTADDLTEAIPFTVNGGNSVSNGTINVIGGINSDAIVEIIPDMGYDLTYFTVNGVPVSGRFYEVPAFSAPLLNIEVEFEEYEGDRTSIDFTLFGGYNYESATPLSGIVDFVGEYNQSALVTDGVASVVLPDGDYVVKMNGYDEVAVTIENGEFKNSSEITLNKLMFDVANTNWTVAENPDGGYDVKSNVSDYSGVKALSVINFDDAIATGAIAIEFTYNGVSSDTTKYFPAFIFKLENGDNRNMQLCQWGKTLTWKDVKTNASLAVVKDSYEGEFSVDLKLIVSDSTVSLFMHDGEAYQPLSFCHDLEYNIKGLSLKYNAQHSSSLPEGDHETFGADWSIEGFKFTEVKEIAVSYQEKAGDAEKVMVRLNKETVKFGQSVTVTVIPTAISEGVNRNVVLGVYVNGEEIDFVTDDEGGTVIVTATYTVNDIYLEECVITVDVLECPVSEVEINVFASDIGSTEEVPLADGKTVKIVGMVIEEIVVENCKITANVPDGLYVIMVIGYIPQTVEIANGELVGNSDAKLVFIEELLINGIAPKQDSSVVRASFASTGYSEEKGYYLSGNDNYSYASVTNRLSIVDGFEITFKLNLNTTNESKFYPAVQIWGLNASGELDRIFTQLCIYSGNLTLKNRYKVNGATQESSLIASAGSFTGEFKVRAVLTNGWVEVKLFHGQTEMLTVTSTQTGTSLSTISSVGFFFNYDKELTTNESYEITNISVLPIA